MISESSDAAESQPPEQSKNAPGEANPSGAVNQSEDESGNENRQKNVRRRKRAHEGSENAKGTSAEGRSGRACRAGGGRSKRRRVEAVTLFEVITMGRSAMRAVIDDWIEAYVADRDSSLLDLISFFIQCSGCKGVVTAEMCQSKEDSDVMSKMVEELDEVASLQYKKFLAFPWILTVTWPMDTDGAEYPLTQSGPYGRWFHSEFCDFVAALVAQCQRGVIFDGYLMSALVSLLTELSDSCIRAFRHTCTLAAVKLTSSLVGVARSLAVGIENSQKLHRVQKAKAGRQRSAPQLERIQKKIAELQEKRAEIESMMDILFKAVFLKRYRDVLPEIRSLCAEELALWMKLYGSVFLNDTCLKYLGWMMYDKIPDVRLRCVLGLQGLFGEPQLLPKLDLFTSRFKDRMISMTLDKDSEVAVQSMKLLVLISKTSDDLLSAQDYKRLLRFVYSSQRPLAASAGELLYSRLLSSVSRSSSDGRDGMNEEDARQLRTSAAVKLLLQFHRESELHEHVAYLVDSLWDCGGALLKDWPALTSLLLVDPSQHGLSLAEQTVLVEILAAAARQASEGPALAGRSGAKKVLSAKEKKIQIDECTKLTEHLLAVLPKLLSKFSAHPDVVASLIRIPQYFVPEASNAQAVSGLAAEVGAALDAHSAPAVLEAASRTYLSLCADETSWGSAARDARDSLVRTWVDGLTVLLRDALQADSFSADEQKTGAILSTLQKLTAFHNCHDLSRWRLFQLLSPLLSTGSIPAEVLREVLRCLCHVMLWSLHASGDTLCSRETAAARRLQLRLFCDRSHHCLTHGHRGVRQQAFLGVCDVLTAHSHQSHAWDPASVGPLLYAPSPKLQRALSTFVCVHVLAGPDCDGGRGRADGVSEAERPEDLHRRRNLLAAFCKLIAHGVLEMSAAAEVFMCYVKFHNEFGDIIKELMCRARQMDKMESARTLVTCLQQLFVRLKKKEEESGAQTFASVKELARRFALTFGDLAKFRECVVTIHRNGIEFVFQESNRGPDAPVPPYLSYLTVLGEFSGKLLKPDKRTVFSYLQRHTAENVAHLGDERWQPLVHYRASLLAAAEGEDAGSVVGSDGRAGATQRAPPSRHKREGSGSPGLLGPAESKVGKGHASNNVSPRTATTEPFSTLPDPPAARLNKEGDVFGANEADDDHDEDDDTLDVEL